MALNQSEQVIAEDLVCIIDFASRVLFAEPGSHYQWDKSDEAAAQFQRLHDHLTGTVTDEDGERTYYQPRQDPINRAKVQAYVARESRHYELGKLMFPNGTTRGQGEEQDQ